MRNTEFADKSNKYANDEARWCSKHVTGFWGKNPLTGEWYKRCTRGNKLNEDCEPVDENN